MRIFTMFFLNSILLFTLPFVAEFVKLPLAWYLTMVITFLMGCSMAVINSTLVGFAGLLPPRYMSGLLLGISFNGLSIVGLRYLTLLSFGLLDPVAYFYGSVIYFTTASIFMLFCAFGILVVIK